MLVKNKITIYICNNLVSNHIEMLCFNHFIREDILLKIEW